MGPQLVLLPGHLTQASSPLVAFVVSLLLFFVGSLFQGSVVLAGLELAMILLPL